MESEAHSVTTESDSGKPGSIGAPSEVGTEETAGNKKYFLYYLYSHCELSEKHCALLLEQCSSTHFNAVS